MTIDMMINLVFKSIKKPDWSNQSGFFIDLKTIYSDVY
jgi:hypothetical protein